MDVISCDGNQKKCNAGAHLITWLYMAQSGVVSENCFPYSGQGGGAENCPEPDCPSGAVWIKYFANDFYMVENIDAIKEELVAKGPVTTEFEIYTDFLEYKGGIYEYTGGVQEGFSEAIILGYGNEDGKDFWICQLSWGPEWGESGFFRIKFGAVTIDENGCVGMPYIS